ncbi:PAS domain S-box-containing protein [Desulfatibacillum alkenivorans DSM 16219]|jgi:two-component system NtrC family sensor kinase|uniref:histidine kinase n=1 Tax=Desulfatibacillum alkenivorans DSM 16219 TaxID=1121393 RepID=A0A1M6KFM8_9BACT|nr:PAS domain S-box-containing protein [Desulfatibacillum alkenivorans DSM 16219]
MENRETPRLISILHAMQDGIYVVNADYTVEFMNEAMIRIFGDHTGKKCHEMLIQSQAPCSWCRAKEVFEEQATVQYEMDLERVGKVFRITELPLTNADQSISKMSIFRDVTRSKQQERKIRSHKQDYERLFDQVPCGVYVSSKEGNFLDANPALLKMLNYDSKEEFLAMDIARDIYLNAEDRDKFMEMIEKSGMVSNYAVDFKTRDGKPVSVIIAGHVRYDDHGEVLGYEGIIVDQSQRKLMEREVQEAHDFFDKVIQSSPNAIMAADMKGNILIWNRGAEELLGYKAHDVIGRMNIVDVYPEGMARRVMKMMRSREHGGRGLVRSYPLLARTREGEFIEANMSAAIIYDAQGREMASVGIMVDMRERASMEQKLNNVKEQLLQSEKLAAMGKLTSQLAHELNNPLFGIMNTLELLKTEIPETSKRRKILDMALSETVRISEMLKKMLSFSKPDQEERQITDINTILEELLLLHERQLQENDVKVVRDLAEGLEPVMASKNQLRQVFLNVIANARDAMPEGGTFTITSRAQGDFIYIDLADTGVGIPEENLSKIFDTFFTTKGSVQGVGLGLSVCYGFIRDHGGDIKVSSVPGEGTTFTVSLPIHRPEE